MENKWGDLRLYAHHCVACGGSIMDRVGIICGQSDKHPQLNFMTVGVKPTLRSFGVILSNTRPNSNERW